MRSYLVTADGLRLHHREWPAERPAATVVLVHGFAASARDPAVTRQAESLQANGYHVVSYDARGHGHSEGFSTFGDLEYHDVAAAIASVRHRDHPLIAVGASMGAVAALRYAAHTNTADLAGIVAISAPAAWRIPRSPQGVGLAALIRTPGGRRVARRRMNVRVTPRLTLPEPLHQTVKRLRVPLAIIQGDQDRYVTIQDAHTLHHSCRAPVTLQAVTGMGHAFHPLALPAVNTAINWILTESISAN